MYLLLKRAVFPPWVSGETLYVGEEFKYPEVLFIREVKMEREIDRLISATSTVMQLLYQFVKAKLKGKTLGLPMNLHSTPHLWL